MRVPLWLGSYFPEVTVPGVRNRNNHCRERGGDWSSHETFLPRPTTKYPRSVLTYLSPVFFRPSLLLQWTQTSLFTLLRSWTSTGSRPEQKYIGTITVGGRWREPNDLYTVFVWYPDTYRLNPFLSLFFFTEYSSPHLLLLFLVSFSSVSLTPRVQMRRLEKGRWGEGYLQESLWVDWTSSYWLGNFLTKICIPVDTKV